jgi:hypothetical protein
MSIMELGEELRAQLTNLVALDILYEKALSTPLSSSYTSGFASTF